MPERVAGGQQRGWPSLGEPRGDGAAPCGGPGRTGVGYLGGWGLSSCGGANPNCVRCNLDGVGHDCASVFNLVSVGVARQCPDNNCGPVPIQGEDENGNPHYAWRVFTGSGFWVSDGTDSENIFFDEIEYRDPHDPFSWAMSFQGKKGKGKGRNRENAKKKPGPFSRPPEVFYPVPSRDAIILQGVHIEHFNAADTELIKRRILAIGNNQACLKAYEDAKLKSLIDIIFENGLVIRPATDFLNYNAQSLGLHPKTFDMAKVAFRFDKSEGRPQAGTIRGFTNGVRGTADGRTQIYLDGSAFLSRSDTSAYFGLDAFEDVITHELIHAGGQPPTPGRLGSFRHDLAGFGPYSKILEACK